MTDSNKVGRPTKYQPEYNAIVKKMCELGATDADIASALGIVLSTLYLWKHEHSEFSDSLKAGKDVCDDRVEMSLYRRAVGFEREEVKIFQFQGEPILVPYTEYVDPDTTAGIFWLKNRRPDKWRAAPEPSEDEEVVSPVKIEVSVVDARADKSTT